MKSMLVYPTVEGLKLAKPNKKQKFIQLERPFLEIEPLLVSEPLMIKESTYDLELTFENNLIPVSRLMELKGFVEQYASQTQDASWNFLFLLRELHHAFTGTFPVCKHMGNKVTLRAAVNTISLNDLIDEWMKEQRSHGYEAWGWIQGELTQQFQSPIPTTKHRIYFILTRDCSGNLVSTLSSTYPNIEAGSYSAKDFKKGSPLNVALYLPSQHQYAICRQLPLTESELRRLVNWVKTEDVDHWEELCLDFFSKWVSRPITFESSSIGAIPIILK